VFEGPEGDVTLRRWLQVLLGVAALGDYERYACFLWHRLITLFSPLYGLQIEGLVRLHTLAIDSKHLVHGQPREPTMGLQFARLVTILFAQEAHNMPQRVIEVHAWRILDSKVTIVMAEGLFLHLVDRVDSSSTYTAAMAFSQFSDAVKTAYCGAFDSHVQLEIAMSVQRDMDVLLAIESRPPPYAGPLPLDTRPISRLTIFVDSKFKKLDEQLQLRAR
jgi:hypothetical protein